MRIALISLLLTWIFFFEYIPPTKRVHLWSDIEGYHYPLLDYAHKSLWQGRLPLWDPAIYCGVPFAGNIQAGLFYPPNWLLFVANARMPAHLRGASQASEAIGMRYTSVEILAIVHVWLAFVLTYFWLRERTTGWLPAALGGMVVACGGYMLSQIVHLGLICGYAWIPLALWGIERANRTGNWREMWRVAVAASLCLLAGYPPTLVALGLVCMAYAAALSSRKRLVPLTAAALLFSAVLGAVQLLPTMEATRLKQPEVAFGAYLPNGNEIYASMLLPNWFDQNRTTSGPEASRGDCLYLGVPLLFGLAWLARRGRFRGAGPAFIIAGVTLFIAVDPTGLVMPLVEHMPVVSDVVRRYYLLPGVVIAAALLAASGVDDFLARRSERPVPKFVTFGWTGLMAIWSAYLLTTNQFRVGWESALYPAVTLALFASGLYLLRWERRAWVAVLLALGVLAEFQAFGTNRRFNATDGNVDSGWRGDARLGGKTLNGLDDETYHEMLKHPGYRVALYEGPYSTDLRHYGLATLQGFDPFVTAQYKTAVERFTPFTTNRLFDVNPLDEEMLRHFGVRWVFVRNETPMQATLDADERFRKLPPGTSYFIVFEYLHAQPAWRFDGEARQTRWDPEHRSFQVTSDAGGRFVLLEQFFPGWRALLDGKETAIERVDETFQGIAVPPGHHAIEFRYVPRSLCVGAVVSLMGLAMLVYVVRRPAVRVFG
jgi:hypothetical protein